MSLLITLDPPQHKHAYIYTNYFTPHTAEKEMLPSVIQPICSQFMRVCQVKVSVL